MGLRTMKKETLAELDAHAAQGVHLLLALDALGDDPRADLVGQLAERLEEAPLDAALVDVPHQADVELQEELNDDFEIIAYNYKVAR